MIGGVEQRLPGFDVPKHVLVDDFGAEEQVSSYRPIDLSTVTNEPVIADLLDREDGVSLFYRGRINWLFGQPESGKTWVAALVAKQVLEAGGTVAWFDMEDTPQTFLERMTSLGVDRAVVIDQERVRYAQPHEPLFSGDKIWAKNAGEIEGFKAWGPDLVVFDACAESMSLEGKSISNNDDVTDWITKVIRPWTHVGAAVLVIDHLPKSDENRNDRYPIGGQHKLSGLDGSAIRTNMVQKFGRNMGSTDEVLRGIVRLTVTKDRSGGVRGPIIQNGGDDPDAAGELVLDIQSNGAIGAFIREADASQLERKEQYAAEVIKDVITVLNEVGVSSGNAVFAALTSEPFSWRLGKEKVKGFLELGVAKGWISVEDGPRNARLYSTNK